MEEAILRYSFRSLMVAKSVTLNKAYKNVETLYTALLVVSLDHLNRSLKSIVV